MYPDSRVWSFDVLFVCGSDFVLRDEVWSDLCTLLKNASSPGVPWMYDHSLNEALKEFDSASLKAMVEARLRLLSLFQLPEGCWDSADLSVDPAVGPELVRRGLADPVRLFGKNEPQKRTKPTRNIASVGVVDALIDVLLFHSQNQEEIRVLQRHERADQEWLHPSSVGFNMYDPRTAARFTQRVHRMASRTKRVFSNDVQGFEYSFHRGCHNWRREWWFRLKQRQKQDSWWFVIANARFYCQMHPLLMSSDGALFTLTVAIMLSGLRSTAHDDSLVRAMLPTLTTLLVTGPPPQDTEAYVECVDNGDDCAEEGVLEPEQSAAAYAACGFTLSDCSVVPYVPLEQFSFHFCSQVFTSTGCKPEAYGKALFNLLQNKTPSWPQLGEFCQRYVLTGLVDLERLRSVYPPMEPYMGHILEAFPVLGRGKELEQINKQSMPKVGKKKQKPARGKQPRAQRAVAMKPRRSLGSIHQGVHQACTLSNPFCPEADQARWPDGATSRSVCYNLRSQQNVDTGSTGLGCTIVLGDLSYPFNFPTAMTGSSVTANATNVASGVTFPTGIVRYRLTSWGVKVDCVSPPMTTQGKVHVRLYSPMTGSTLGTFSPTTYSADNWLDVTMASLIEKPLFIFPSPLGIEAREFRDPSAITATLANWQNPGWQVVTVSIIGGPVSTTPVTLTLFAHYEVIFADGDPSTTFATPPPTPAIAVQQTVPTVLQQVGGFIQTGANNVDAVYQTKAGKALMDWGAGAIARRAGSVLSRAPNPYAKLAGAGMLMLTNGHPMEVD